MNLKFLATALFLSMSGSVLAQQAPKPFSFSADYLNKMIKNETSNYLVTIVRESQLLDISVWERSVKRIEHRGDSLIEIKQKWTSTMTPNNRELQTWLSSTDFKPKYHTRATNRCYGLGFFVFCQQHFLSC
ncbi:hypothetical protein EP331_02485 [bacterium]|nr:MAG: hypothetical protein EP331_02485 [bacterium]